MTGETRGPQPGLGRRPRAPADKAVPASSVQPRWLFIVHPGETALYQHLATRLAGVARVVLDQRRGDRRRGRASVGSDRRRGDRRRLLPAGVTLARGLGYHLVYHSTQVDVYEVESPSVPAVCPECGMVLAFDMPRFAQPPAHVELVVHHTRGWETVAHAVEVHATGTSGQALLSCQLEARPYTWSIEGVGYDP